MSSQSIGPQKYDLDESPNDARGLGTMDPPMLLRDASNDALQTIHPTPDILLSLAHSPPTSQDPTALGYNLVSNPSFSEHPAFLGQNSAMESRPPSFDNVASLLAVGGAIAGRHQSHQQHHHIQQHDEPSLSLAPPQGDFLRAPSNVSSVGAPATLQSSIEQPTIPFSVAPIGLPNPTTNTVTTPLAASSTTASTISTASPHASANTATLPRTMSSTSNSTTGDDGMQSVPPLTVPLGDVDLSHLVRDVSGLSAQEFTMRVGSYTSHLESSSSNLSLHNVSSNPVGSANAFPLYPESAGAPSAAALAAIAIAAAEAVSRPGINAGAPNMSTDTSDGRNSSPTIVPPTPSSIRASPAHGQFALHGQTPGLAPQTAPFPGALPLAGLQPLPMVPSHALPRVGASSGPQSTTVVPISSPQFEPLQRSGSSFTGLSPSHSGSQSTIKLEDLMQMRLQNIQLLSNQLSQHYGQPQQQSPQHAPHSHYQPTQFNMNPAFLISQHPQDPSQGAAQFQHHQAPTLHFFGNQPAFSAQQAATASGYTIMSGQGFTLMPFTHQPQTFVDSPGSVNTVITSQALPVAPTMASGGAATVAPNQTSFSATSPSSLNVSPMGSSFAPQPTPHQQPTTPSLLGPAQYIIGPDDTLGQMSLGDVVSKYVPIPLSGYAEAPSTRELANSLNQKDGRISINKQTSQMTSTGQEGVVSTLSPAEAGFNPNAIPFPVAHLTTQLRPGRGAGLRGTKDEVTKLRLQRKAERARLTRSKRKAYAMQLEIKAAQLRRRVEQLEERERTASERQSRTDTITKHVVRQIARELESMWLNANADPARSLPKDLEAETNSKWSTGADRAELNQIVTDTMMMMPMNSGSPEEPYFIPSVDLGFHVLRRIYAALGIHFMPDDAPLEFALDPDGYASEQRPSELTLNGWLRARRTLEGGRWVSVPESAMSVEDALSEDTRAHSIASTMISRSARHAIASLPPPQLSPNISTARENEHAYEQRDTESDQDPSMSSYASDLDSRHLEWAENCSEADGASVITDASGGAYGPTRMQISGTPSPGSLHEYAKYQQLGGLGTMSNPTTSPQPPLFDGQPHDDEDQGVPTQTPGTPGRFRHLPPPPKLQSTPTGGSRSTTLSPSLSPQLNAGIRALAIDSNSSTTNAILLDNLDQMSDAGTVASSVSARGSKGSRAVSSTDGASHHSRRRSSRRSTAADMGEDSAGASGDEDDVDEDEEETASATRTNTSKDAKSTQAELGDASTARLGFLEGLNSGLLQAKDIDIAQLNVDELTDEQVAKLLRQLSYSAEDVRANAWRIVKRLEKSLDFGRSVQFLFFMSTFDQDTRSRVNLIKTHGDGDNMATQELSYSTTISPGTFSGLVESRPGVDAESGREGDTDGDDVVIRALNQTDAGSAVHLQLFAELNALLRERSDTINNALDQLQVEHIVNSVTGTLRNWSKVQRDLARTVLQVRDYLHQLDTIFAAIRAIFGQRGLLKLRIGLARQPKFAALIRFYMRSVFSKSS